MILGDFLDITAAGSIINLTVDEETVFKGSLEHFYQDFWDCNNDKFNSCIEEYIDCQISDFSWSSECLTVNIYSVFYDYLG